MKMEMFKELSRDSILMELSKDVQPLEDLLGLLGSADPLSSSPDVTGEFSFPQQHAVQDSLGFDSLLSDLQQFDKADDAFGEILSQGPTDFSDVLSSLSDFTALEPKVEQQPQQHSIAAVDNFSTLDIESLLLGQDSLSAVDVSPVDSLSLADASAFLQSDVVTSTISPAASSTSSSFSSPVESPVGSPQPEGTRTPQLKKLLLDPDFKGWEEPQVTEVSSPPEPAGYIEVDVMAASPSSTASGYTLTSEADSLPSSPKSSVRYQPYERQQRSRGEETRKERKRLQNQQAATRYRQKKKQEQGTISQQSKALTEENKKLQDKVDGLAREIKYMKDLLVEVYKAKGLISDAEELQRSLK